MTHPSIRNGQLKNQHASDKRPYYKEFKISDRICKTKTSHDSLCHRSFFQGLPYEGHVGSVDASNINRKFNFGIL